MKQDLPININKHLENVPDGTYISHKIDGNTETSYKLKMKGKGYSKAYLIFPGITLAYQYFLGDKIDFHHDALNTSLEINHCHKGRIGIHMKDNKKVFLGQGDMAFQSMDCCADSIRSDLTSQKLNHAQEKAKILSIYSISIFRAVYTAIM